MKKDKKSMIEDSGFLVYACGIVNNDWDKWNFQVMAICDSAEKATKMIEKIRKEYPEEKRENIYFKTFTVNKFYEDGLIE